MAIAFTKMQGLGNDFVVIDMREKWLDLSPTQIAFMGNRHFGIGFDQLLIISSDRQSQADIHYSIYNPDGSESGQCGNGVRCVAQYVDDHGGIAGESLTVATNTTTMEVFRAGSMNWRVNMGIPQFDANKVPIKSNMVGPMHHVDMMGRAIEVFATSLGNPHAVINNDYYMLDVNEYGPLLESHPIFPQRANIGFAHIINRNQLSLRVYERGAGETIACGSGACAAAVSGIYQNWCDSQLTVTLPGGDLQLEWEKGDNPVWMTGPAAYVFEGTIEL